MKYKVKLETNEIRYKEYIVDAESEGHALEVAKKVDFEKNKLGNGANVMIRTIQSPRGVEKIK